MVEGSPGFQKRFIRTTDLLFKAVTIQARDRAASVVPGLEDYIDMRRDTSGCEICWTLIEYANDLDLPDEVMDHPIIQSLDEATNDLVAWSNVSIYTRSFPFLRFSFSTFSRTSRTSSRTIVNRPKVSRTT